MVEEGKFDEAVSKFQQALELDPKVDLDPNTEEIEQNPQAVANKLAAPSKVSEGSQLAQEGKIDEAVIRFQQALGLDPKIDLNPDTEDIDQNPQAVAKVSEGSQLAQEGEIDEAIAAYEQAQQLDPALEIDADSWSILCWYGSIYGYAKKVLFAGEKAVELSQQDSTDIIGTRGLARALTGDFTGAIADFQALADDPNQDEEFRPQVEQWIKALKQGENPFTQEVLDEFK